MRTNFDSLSLTITQIDTLQKVIFNSACQEIDLPIAERNIDYASDIVDLMGILRGLQNELKGTVWQMQELIEVMQDKESLSNAGASGRPRKDNNA